MIQFIELTDSTNKEYLIDFASGWQITQGDNSHVAPARIHNPQKGQELDSILSYNEIKYKLIRANML